MGLSRRHLLLALGLALPAMAVLSEDAEAATSQNAKHSRRRSAHAKPTTKKKPQAHANQHRRRKPTTA